MRTTGIALLCVGMAIGASVLAQQTTPSRGNPSGAAHSPAPSHGTADAGAGSRASIATINNVGDNTGANMGDNTGGTAANGYVDPALCTQCHADIAKSYALTGMGRSFTKVTTATIENFPSDQPFFHAPSQSFFSIVEHDGNVYQRRWQIGFDGKQTNIEEKKIDYEVGSGNHAKTYLHLTARNTLQQLPLGWYAENGGSWNMIPGFDRPDYPGSTRDVQYECMFCHNGYPKISAANAVEDAEPDYQQPLPMGIDCQRCHGPGQRHIDTLRTNGATLDQVRASIVNPGKLTPEREMEVCMQCHLETTSLKLPHSLQRADRGPFSYLPGQPLGDFKLSFDRAPGQNKRLEVAGAAYRLRKSQCFLQTQDKPAAQRMQCTTCHDPHNIPRGAEATTHYNSVCGTCHTTQIAQAVSAGTHPPNPDCISCHMQKRRTDDAVHIVMTDHFIQREPPPDPSAPKKEYYESEKTSYKGEVVLYYPTKLAPTERNQLDLAVAQVQDGSNLRGGVPQLKALLERYRPANPDYYSTLATATQTTPSVALPLYEEALKRATGPSVATMLLKLGGAQVDWQQWPAAESTLRRATGVAPDDPVAWTLLGEALYQEGKDAEAKDALNKAVALDADMPEPHNYLGALLVQQQDAANAENEFREALRLQPTHAEWQSNLAGLLAAEGRNAEAQFLFQLSIRLDPSFAGAHLNYARLLVSTGQNAEAAKEAQAAVEDDSKNADAHELLGYLLGVEGDANDAARELRAAVALDPKFWRAHLELGMALRMTGDAPGAAQQWRIAAQSDDPQVRAAAQQLLAPGR